MQTSMKMQKAGVIAEPGPGAHSWVPAFAWMSGF